MPAHNYPSPEYMQTLSFCSPMALFFCGMTNNRNRLQRT